MEERKNENGRSKKGKRGRLKEEEKILKIECGAGVACVRRKERDEYEKDGTREEVNEMKKYELAKGYAIREWIRRKEGKKRKE